MTADSCYRLGAATGDVFTSLGVPLDTLCRARRSFAHPCLDWSERRCSAGLLAALSERGWVSRRPTSRAVALHITGRAGLVALLGRTLPSGRAPDATLPTTG